MGETRSISCIFSRTLQDTYPGAIEETILTEVVANALDSGSRSASETDPAGHPTSSTTARASAAQPGHHDIAATTKTRGQGIGFAGVGIKLGPGLGGGRTERAGFSQQPG